MHLAIDQLIIRELMVGNDWPVWFSLSQLEVLAMQLDIVREAKKENHPGKEFDIDKSKKKSDKPKE